MRAKKHLGQNFLTSVQVARDIVRAGNVMDSDTVLEIGPGKGMLTRELVATGAHVVVIEKDAELIPILRQTFANEMSSGQLELIEGDALKYTPNGTYKLIANIPYYITGEIIRKFLTAEMQPKSITILVQKEVAERIVAKNGKESILSLSVKAFGKPRVAMKVPARFFSPKPKVDSAVLTVENISREFFTGISEEAFFETVKAGFAQKRKKLLNNLTSLTSKEKIVQLFVQLNIQQNTRAEDVPLELWRELAVLATTAEHGHK